MNLVLCAPSEDLNQRFGSIATDEVLYWRYRLRMNFTPSDGQLSKVICQS